MFLNLCLCWKGVWVGWGVWMGVGRPCPPIRNNSVTPRHLFANNFLASYTRFYLQQIYYWLQLYSVRPWSQ